MSALASPLHVGSIDGVEVRFFTAPRARLELPWHAVDDLYEAMRLHPEVRQTLLRHSRTFPGADVATVPTATGPVVISSHVMGQGLIEAAAEFGAIRRAFEGEYVKAAMAAMDAMNRGYPAAERFERAIRAAHNSLGTTADTPQVPL